MIIVNITISNLNINFHAGNVADLLLFFSWDTAHILCISSEKPHIFRGYKRLNLKKISETLYKIISSGLSLPQPV